MDSRQWTRKSSFKVCGLGREVKRTTPKTWWVGQGLVNLGYAPQFLWWTTKHRNVRFLILTTNSPDYLWVFLSSNIKANPSFDVCSESMWTLCHPSELIEGIMNRKPKYEHLKPLISAACGIKSSLDWWRGFFHNTTPIFTRCCSVWALGSYLPWWIAHNGRQRPQICTSVSNYLKMF